MVYLIFGKNTIKSKKYMLQMENKFQQNPKKLKKLKTNYHNRE